MPGTFLCHERMAVVNPDNGRVVNGVKQPTGEQPMWSHTRRYSWIHNGEIYNHQALEEKYDIQAPSGSDSEVIGFLYEKLGPAFVKELDGMYAFVVVDREEGTTFAARDHMGIIPMYMARGKDGSVYFGSEMKIFAGDDQIESYEEFPPGFQFTRLADGTEKMERWYEPRWITDRDYVPTEEVDYTKVREAFIDAVVSHMMVDVNHGVLLSGGLDSSLVTAVAVKHGMKASNRKWHNEKLHSFSVGIEGAPDLLAARKVAEFLGTDHHEFTFTAQEALDALPDVVYHIESFEQVRASVPMFLLSSLANSANGSSDLSARSILLTSTCTSSSGRVDTEVPDHAPPVLRSSSNASLLVVRVSVACVNDTGDVLAGPSSGIESG